jgi:UDP-N-acetylglucosamine--N-acetylmuramyl-(pentapeptide) pyrophosphoryl-undecaprenol N-acetylglucosamine transferase
VRPAVIAAASTPYPALDPNGDLRLLVFGGSQGARVMADVVPLAIERLEPRLQMRLKIIQQAREEDMERVREIYAKLNIAAKVEPFFKDLPAAIAASLLIVALSGASTVAELTAIGRPGILVPLPNALDQDQHYNAGILMDAGGAIRLPQAEFTPDRLASEIAALAAEPSRLAGMAAAAKRAGAIDAADRLADLVLRVAGITK